jgi:alpha-1,6-mannosyltransferase
VSRVYSAFDVTVASSPSVARELRALGVPRVRHVSLGVDLETFRPAGEEELPGREAMGIPDDGRPVGIYAGRFCAEKRLDVLLDGHALLPVESRPHLLLVGGGPHRDRLERLARERPRVHLHPYVQDREHLARLYAASDFYAAPGPGETFGLSIAEAMACGLPVLVVDRGAAPDRVGDSGCGEPYTHGRPGSCARAMATLVDRLSPDLRQRARAHAEVTYGWAATFDRLVELYRELAGARVR